MRSPQHGVGGWGSSCRTHTCCQKGPEIVGSHRRTDAHQARLHKAKRQTVYMRQHQGQRAGVEQRIARTGADIGTTVARRRARAGTVRPRRKLLYQHSNFISKMRPKPLRPKTETC